MAKVQGGGVHFRGRCIGVGVTAVSPVHAECLPFSVPSGEPCTVAEIQGGGVLLAGRCMGAQRVRGREACGVGFGGGDDPGAATRPQGTSTPLYCIEAHCLSVMFTYATVQ